MAKKNNDHIFFYGFVVGAAFMLMPIPKFFFWNDVIELVESFFRYIGFIFFILCGATILVRVVRACFGK